MNAIWVIGVNVENGVLCDLKIVKFPKDLKIKLKVKAAQNDITLRELIIKILEEGC